MKIAIRKCSPRAEAEAEAEVEAEAVEASPRVLCLSFIRTVKVFIVVAATHVLVVVVAVVANVLLTVLWV